MRPGKHLRDRVAGFVWVIAVVGTVPALAKTVYVSKTGSDANDGLTWTTAKLTVQEGLNTAVPDDQVWVAAGTYVENITLVAGVALYGGFAGNETDLAQRNWVTNKTILDGNQAGSVVTSPLETATIARIDGFIIRNGIGTDSQYGRRGGGIYCSHASPTIANNAIIDNTASHGGAVYCRSSPALLNNTISNNTAGEGGGIYCSQASPTIANNAITGNLAAEGGGIFCISSSPTIANNTISTNTASSRGGGLYCSSSSPIVVNNMIIGNTANSGGAFFCRNSPSTITNNTLAANSAVQGGGIHCRDCSPTIANTVVSLNSSGIYLEGSGTPTLRHNCVFGNAAYDYLGLTDPTGLDGNISINPELADLPYGNAHIQAGSPCVDGGDDAAVEVDWLDIDGQVRIQGSHVDIGADESDGVLWPAGPHAIVRVRPDGDDANDGASWPAAKRTVQAGIEAAAARGGEVWVRAGTYHERIMLRPFTYAYGGFAGMESTRDSRDWAANVTILDGQQAGSVVTIREGHHVSTIDGFTICNGTGTLLGSSRDGGGIYCRWSSSTIANNRITGNTASRGGGIYCDSSSSTITNNTIKGNDGGGVYCIYSSFPLIANNVLTANGGHGICCIYSSPTITNDTITANDASGGGIYCAYSSPTIANTIIALNSSGFCATGTSAPSLRYNCVYGNTAYDYSGITDPTGDNGNISADPKLADLPHGNVHIRPDSPCRNAGDDVVVQAGWLDIDGQLRIIGSHVDIGADESDGTVWAEGPYAIVRVSPEGDDEDDGSSWIAAKRTVQAGIEAAAAGGGEVWVRAGTYHERIMLRPFTYAYGGFAGTESTRDSRDWAANVTILDGQQAGSVVTIREGHRVSTIDGFTIRNGSGTAENSSSYGGGINCSFSSPTIANSKITGNAAVHGGGICWQSSSPTIVNSTIAANTALYGGAIYCNYSTPTITSSTIAGNTALSYGGGIYCGVSSPTITNTLIAFNSSGVYSNGSSGVVLRHNCVFGNSDYNYSNLTDPTGTDGNISADPRLASVAYGNLHIQPDSPCVDAGDDAVVQPEGLDIDGQRRIVGSNVDIGADESDATNWLAGPYVIVRVSANGDDANDGSSWVAAKRTVQEGISTAALLGGEVWVQTGTYYELITLHPFAYLYGGFAGTETARDDRKWISNTTVLDGQQGGSVVTVGAGHGVSSIDGFTLRNGAGTLSGSYRYGGGIYCRFSSPTIANNVIAGNSITGTPYGYGGGVYCSSGSPIVARNMIMANVAAGSSHGEGGGVCCSAGSPVIIDNIITGNAASGSSARLGGGIACFSSSPTIMNNVVTANAAILGGGIYTSSAAAIAGNTITGNTATDGGGICSVSGSATIANNTLVGNSASARGGGLYCSGSSSLRIVNNVITGNVAPGGGGGIYISSYSPAIANTIVAFNSSGIYNSYPDTLALRYSCSYGNSAYNYSSIPDPTGTDGNISADPLFVRPASPSMDGQWETADDDYGDLRLLAGSPCIDAGDNAAVPADVSDLDGDGDIAEPIPFDLACMARFFDDPLTLDTGLGTPPIVDMGAYEYFCATLESSNPTTGKSLWRNKKNVIRLTFGADVAVPDAGAVTIQEMIAGGAYGDDLSAGFTFTVEDDGQGQPRVLKIQETGSTLQHRKWYAVRNTGLWTGVAPFTVQYVVQVGDANNDGRVLNTDFGWVNAAIPNFNTTDDDRRDINGDGRILNTDFGVLNSKIPSFPVAKPDGH